LTPKRIARVCQHQTSFLFYTMNEYSGAFLRLKLRTHLAIGVTIGCTTGCNTDRV